MKSIPPPRDRRKSLLAVEELERRELPAALPPTALEQMLLERLNDARANPAAYGTAIGANLAAVAPSQPLAINALLTDAARGHSIDMSARNYFSHFTPEGVNPGGRILASGFGYIDYGESIAAGYDTPEQALAALIIDDGIPDLGHRRHLLAIDPIFADQRQVGAGVLLNGSGSYTDYYTIDTAGTTDRRAFITGSAYTDRNGNGRYDVGEALGGVTITVAGVGSVTTFSSGGYSIPVNAGTYTVTASGPGLPTLTTTVTVGGSNVRVNFTPTGINHGSAPTGPGPSGSGTTGVAHGQIFVTGTDRGGGPLVNVYDARTGALKSSFNAFDPSFTGGVRVAVGDVNGDGTADVIAAAGPGGSPIVRVFDGKTFQQIREFTVLPASFTGGVFVAVGDVNGDGFADIISAADAGGGPQVTITSGKDGRQLASFYATAATFTGGIRVAAGDVNGDGFADVIAAAGAGGGPQVTVFDGRTLKLMTAFYAFAPGFAGGMFVAAGDVTGNGTDDIVVGADKGGGPQVAVFDGPTQRQLNSYYAFTPSFTGGVRVAVVQRTRDNFSEVLTAAGPGGGPQVETFDGQGKLADSFFAYNSTYTGGVFLGGA